MTFNEFKTYIEDELERNKKYMSNSLANEDYGNVLFWKGSVSALKLISVKVEHVEFELEETQKVHNDFSWDNVNIGDKCVSNGYTGTVSRLIFDSDGYCCGMIVNYFDSDSGDKFDSVYQDNQYNCCEQIGGWANQ